jgi:glyoxylase-like metal-dependent hydrolase (beta-lactamase superfamily II)
MLQCNCSILGDEQTHEGMVVDPGDEVDEILAMLAEHGLKLKSIVITHAHIDHIGGAKKLHDATGAPVYMNENDRELAAMMEMQAAWLGVMPPEMPKIDVAAKDGDRLTLGLTELHVLHTPGHTQGSISLWIPSETRLIAGDTLFRQGIGRTDLPGGNGRQIVQSIRAKLLPLPEETLVIPGHGDNTTIGEEKMHNPFLS